MSHAMSLIWKYVVVNVDQILQSNQNKYKHLIKKFEANVENAVQEKMERFERDRLTFENQRIEYKKEIADLQRQLAGKDRERKKLIEIIQNHEHKYESLRDPTGLQQFKRLISSFTVGLDSILAEKEQQYTAMKSVVRMMDDMGEQRFGENMKHNQLAQKQQQKILWRRLTSRCLSGYWEFIGRQTITFATETQGGLHGPLMSFPNVSLTL